MSPARKPAAAKRSPAKAAKPKPPNAYAALLEELKGRIGAARGRAAASVNRELILLHWQVGRAIALRQRAEGWGRAVVENLARDLAKAFPDSAGFSASNLWRMRAFYLAYADSELESGDLETGRFLAQPVPEIDRDDGELYGNSFVGSPQTVEFLAQPVPETLKFAGASRRLASDELPPEELTRVSWGHNLHLLFKLSNPGERLWYARKAAENGWSRAVLAHQIESGLIRRIGRATHNFRSTLPAPQSDLAEQILKDPYCFEFLALSEGIAEHELETALVERVKDFLLELGTGFAFVGRQYRLDIEGDEYRLDLLFYHTRLHCYVVVDLKVEDFKPEHAGKMNFYLAAVDDLVRGPEDAPSIGLILCKRRKRIVAEYALRDTRRPMGVSVYRLPPAPYSALPAAAQIEATLSELENAAPTPVAKRRGIRAPKPAEPEPSASPRPRAKPSSGKSSASPRRATATKKPRPTASKSPARVSRKSKSSR